MDSYASVRLERRGHVLEVTLSRPELLNRVDALAHKELIAVWRSLEDDHDLRAVVLAAEGRVFSAGGDFELMLAANADLRAGVATVDDGARLLSALLSVTVPIVVALQGDAIGLGATLALACDAVVTHPRVAISDPHVSIGLVAGDGGCVVWPQAVGMMVAKRHLLTGDPIDGSTAHRLGLVSDLVEEPAEVLPAARALADRLAALPPLAVQGTKRALNAAVRHRSSEVMDLALAQELISLRSADLREAVAAFRERRPAHFEGR